MITWQKLYLLLQPPHLTTWSSAVVPEPEPDTYVDSHTWKKMCLIKWETLTPQLTKLQAKGVKIMLSSTLLFISLKKEKVMLPSLWQRETKYPVKPRRVKLGWTLWEWGSRWVIRVFVKVIFELTYVAVFPGPRSGSGLPRHGPLSTSHFWLGSVPLTRDPEAVNSVPVWDISTIAWEKTHSQLAP